MLFELLVDVLEDAAYFFSRVLHILVKSQPAEEDVQADFRNATFSSR